MRDARGQLIGVPSCAANTNTQPRLMAFLPSVAMSAVVHPSPTHRPRIGFASCSPVRAFLGCIHGWGKRGRIAAGWGLVCVQKSRAEAGPRSRVEDGSRPIPGPSMRARPHPVASRVSGPLMVLTFLLSCSTSLSTAIGRDKISPTKRRDLQRLRKPLLDLIESTPG